MLNYNIRLAIPEDYLSLVELNYKFNGVKRTPVEVKQSLLNTNEIIALVLSDESVVGFGCAQYFNSFCYPEPHGEITELFIIEDFRGEGLGIEITRFLENRLQQIGVENIKILTGSNNKKAQNTYQMANYLLVDEIVYQKKLKGSAKLRSN